MLVFGVIPTGSMTPPVVRELKNVFVYILNRDLWEDYEVELFPKDLGGGVLQKLPDDPEREGWMEVGSGGQPIPR